MAEIQRIGSDEVARHFEDLTDPRSTVNRRHPLVRGYPVIRTIRKLLLFQEVRTQRRPGSMHQCARPTLPTSVMTSGP
jgi:hypothetical protein